MSSRGWRRFCLALAASALIHALLLWGGGKAVVDGSRVDLAARSAWRLQAVLRHTDASAPHAAVAGPTHPRPRLADPRPRDVAGPPERLSAEPRRDAVGQDRLPAPQPRRDEPASAPPAAAAEASSRALGAALNAAVTQQYMMMRLQQFFTAARAGAKRRLEGRLTPEKMERYQGKRCSFQLAFASPPAEAYHLVRAECDDPDLAQELDGLDWSGALPLPAAYSLPYRGLVVLLAVRGYDISIGLTPLDN